MKLHFFLNASNRHDKDPSDDKFRPMFNLPSTPAVQVALHSPYHLPSPYIEGKNFLVGRDYEIRLTMVNISIFGFAIFIKWFLLY